MDITTAYENTEEPTLRDVQVDIAHTSRLSQKEKSVAYNEAQEFLERINTRYVHDAYLHLDVKRVKESKRGVDGLKWKALLVTNRGRFVAEQIGYGIFNSLHETFDAMEMQLRRLH